MSYEKVRFFSATWLKDNSIVDVNADVKIVERAIIEAQEIYIRPMLGTALYNKLCADIPTLTGDYKVLMDQYIVDCLLHWSLYILAPNMVYKWRNRSIDTQSGENSTPIASDEIKYLQNQEKNKAEAYGKRLVDYLCVNTAKYPELYQNTTGDMIQPNHTSYTVSMYLGPDIDDKDRFYA